MTDSQEKKSANVFGVKHLNQVKSGVTIKNVESNVVFFFKTKAGSKNPFD